MACSLLQDVTARSMLQARSGVIINIASTAELVGKDRRIYRGTGMGGATLDYHAARGRNRDDA
jgi:hypothetical protein